MKKNDSLLKPKEYDPQKVCIVLGVISTLATIAALWFGLNAAKTIGSSSSTNCYIVSAASAILTIFLFYGGLTSGQAPAAMTNLGEYQLRARSSGMAYGRIFNAFEEELHAKSTWPSFDSNPQLKQEAQKLSNDEKWAEQWPSVEILLKAVPENLALNFQHAAVLGKLDRFFEAEKVLDKLCERDDLCSATKVTLYTQRLCFIMRQNQIDKAGSRLQEVLAGSFDQLERAYVLDVMACQSFMCGCPQFIQDADHWSKLALELQPDLWTLKGTRGAVLVELEREAEAAPMLRDVFDHSEALNDKGITSLYLGICAKRAGNLKAAKRWFRRAHELWPTAWLIERINAESKSLNQPR